MTLRLILLLTISITTLQGCVPVVVAGAATGVVVARDQRSMGTFIDDNALEAKIKNSIAKDKALKKQTHINVTTINGIVLLTGEAPNKTAQDKIIAKVKQFKSVRHIHNQIKIGPNTPFKVRSKDAWITSKVKTKIIGSKSVDSSGIKVVTSKAHVYLMGLIEKSQAKPAVNVARRTKGVKRVVTLFEYTK